MTDDRELARRMLAGDERAFEEFFDGHFPGLYRFALTRLDRDEDAAEEVAQAALCKAISKLATYRGEAALFTWLCTFCRHEICALLPAATGGAAPGRPDRGPAGGAGGAGVAARVARRGPRRGARPRRSWDAWCRSPLDRLPPHYGDALEWKYLEGLAVKEIAARLGLSAKAAESLLTRAREAFRDGFSALVQGAASFPSPAGDLGVAVMSPEDDPPPAPRDDVATLLRLAGRPPRRARGDAGPRPRRRPRGTGTERAPAAAPVPPPVDGRGARHRRLGPPGARAGCLPEPGVAERRIAAARPPLAGPTSGSSPCAARRGSGTSASRGRAPCRCGQAPPSRRRGDRDRGGRPRGRSGSLRPLAPPRLGLPAPDPRPRGPRARPRRRLRRLGRRARRAGGGPWA